MPYPTLVLPPLAFPSSSLPPLVNYFHSSQQCIPLGIAPSPTNNRSTGEISRLRSFAHGPHSSWSSLVSSPHPHNQRKEGSQSIFSRENPLNYSNTYTFEGAEWSNSTPISFERDMSQTLVLSSCQLVKSLEDFLGLSCEDRNATCSSLRPMLCARYLMFRV